MNNTYKVEDMLDIIQLIINDKFIWILGLLGILLECIYEYEHSFYSFKFIREKLLVSVAIVFILNVLFSKFETLNDISVSAIIIFTILRCFIKISNEADNIEKSDNTCGVLLIITNNYIIYLLSLFSGFLFIMGLLVINIVVIYFYIKNKDNIDIDDTVYYIDTIAVGIETIIARIAMSFVTDNYFYYNFMCVLLMEGLMRFINKIIIAIAKECYFHKKYGI